MTTIDPAASALTGGRHWLRSRTLTTIRWMAIIGQLATIATVELFLGFNLPLLWCFLAIGASVWFNVLAGAYMPFNARLSERAALGWLAFDAAQLTILLALTGGLSNPFVPLFMAPVTVAAAVLGPRSIWILGCAAVLFLCILEYVHLPLRRDNGTIFEIESSLYRVGVWAALTVSVAFISFYVRRVATETQKMADALSATQLALAREQKLSSLGALLAATAHQLGTPLGTIAVASKELEADLADRPELQDDVKLIREQTRRCRDILAELNTSRDTADEQSRLVSLAELIEEAAEPYREFGKRIEILIEDAPDEDWAGPTVVRRPEIVHGLRNMIQNAVDYAETAAYVSVRQDSAHTIVMVADDGPGYSAEALARLGEPFISSRAAGMAGSTVYQGMGLGVFIAKTLLERTGAKVAFQNGRGPVVEDAAVGGAVVRVVWRTHDLTTARHIREDHESID